jgi:hypothetical protein
VVSEAESSESQCTGAKIASAKHARLSASSSGTAVKTDEDNIGQGGRGGGVGGGEARV